MNPIFGMNGLFVGGGLLNQRLAGATGDGFVGRIDVVAVLVSGSITQKTSWILSAIW